MTFLDEEEEANNRNSSNSTSNHGRRRGRSSLFPVVQRNVTQEQKNDALWARGSGESVVEDVEAGVVSRAPVTTVGASRNVEGGFRKRRSSSEPPSFGVEVSTRQSGTTSTDHAAAITPSRLEQGLRGGTESGVADTGAVSHSQSVCPTAAASDASEGSIAIGESVIPQAASSVLPLNLGIAPPDTDVYGGSERGSRGDDRKSAASFPKRRSSMITLGTLTKRLARPGHLRRTSSKTSESAESAFQTPEELARLESVREEL